MSDPSSGDPFFFCDACNVQSATEEAFQEHLGSMDHQIKQIRGVAFSFSSVSMRFIGFLPQAMWRKHRTPGSPWSPRSPPTATSARYAG